MVEQLQLPPRCTSPTNEPAATTLQQPARAEERRLRSVELERDRNVAPCVPTRQRRPAISTVKHGRQSPRNARHSALVRDGAARLARAVLERPVEPLEDRRQLFFDVVHVQVLGIQRVLAVIAVPEEAVLLFGRRWRSITSPTVLA